MNKAVKGKNMAEHRKNSGNEKYCVTRKKKVFDCTKKKLWSPEKKKEL
jgi:hypothetical protein